MPFDIRQPLPPARSGNLITTETADALLVYDQDYHEIHTLNQTAATIWRLLDGQRSATDVLADARANLGPGITLEVVQLALATLADAHLLADPIESATFTEGESRRHFLKKAGIAAAAIPTIASITAPVAMAAFSGTCAQAVAMYGCASAGGTGTDICDASVMGALSCYQWQTSLPCKVCVDTSGTGQYSWNSWWCAIDDPFGASHGPC